MVTAVVAAARFPVAPAWFLTSGLLSRAWFQSARF